MVSHIFGIVTSLWHLVAPDVHFLLDLRTSMDFLTRGLAHPVDRAVPPVIWVGQFAHLYVAFVSMKRMYIIVEAQGDWQRSVSRRRR